MLAYSCPGMRKSMRKTWEDIGDSNSSLVDHIMSAFRKLRVNRKFESEKPQGLSSVTYFFQDSTF